MIGEKELRDEIDMLRRQFDMLDVKMSAIISELESQRKG